MSQNIRQPSSSHHPITLRNADQRAFGSMVEPHRRELQVHCYRMMGSLQDAEDMVQETFLRAWRRRETFEGRASLRAWLYKIATNVCLDSLEKRPRRAIPMTHQAASTLDEPLPADIGEPIWLEPYPDELLVTDEYNPERRFFARENITLAFIAALHLLPPRQRAVLILRDVLDWKANEVAELLDTTLSAVKSALHRARTTLAEQGYMADGSVPRLDEAGQTQLAHYVRAWETADVDALLRLLKADATFSMPPKPSWFRGRENIGGLVGKTIFAGSDAKGRWKLLPTRANGQTAYGLYRYDGASQCYTAYGIQMLTFGGGAIADIITFRIPALVGLFHLPETTAI